MSLSNRVLLAAGSLVFFLGAALAYFGKPDYPRPPMPVERVQQAQTRANDPLPPMEVLSGPWFRTPPAAAKPVSKPPSSAKVDQTSITFLGSSMEKDGTRIYFFKHIASGQFIILKSGETKNGWTLQSATDKTFTLSGAGGLYEVPR